MLSLCVAGELSDQAHPQGMDTDPLPSILGPALDDAAPDAGLSRTAQARDVEITTSTTVSTSRPAAWVTESASFGN